MGQIYKSGRPYSGTGGSSDYTAGDGIVIENDEISTDNMPSSDMSEVANPMPSVMSRRFKYSTEEQVVGEWIDGKPLYQKTITGNLILPTTSGAVAETQHDLTSLNIDTFIDLRGVIFIDNDYVKLINYLTLSHIDSINRGTLYQYQKSINRLSCYLSETPFNSAVETITIQYTKTTD